MSSMTLQQPVIVWKNNPDDDIVDYKSYVLVGISAPRLVEYNQSLAKLGL